MLGLIGAGAAAGMTRAGLAQPVPDTIDDAYVVEQLQALAEGQLRTISQERLLLDALIVQNRQTLSFTASTIERLDGDWRREVYTPEYRTLIPAVMSTAASHFLERVVVLSSGRYTEFMLIDSQGLNAALSHITPDYYQGDENKWLQTFKQGRQGLHIGPYEYIGTTRTWQRQLSITVVDPRSLVPLGTLCAGVAVEGL